MFLINISNSLQSDYFQLTEMRFPSSTAALSDRTSTTSSWDSVNAESGQFDIIDELAQHPSLSSLFHSLSFKRNARICLFVSYSYYYIIILHVPRQMSGRGDIRPLASNFSRHDLKQFLRQVISPPFPAYCDWFHQWLWAVSDARCFLTV